MVYLSKKMDSLEGLHPINTLTPIKLTEEWLERFGICKRGGYYVLYDDLMFRFKDGDLDLYKEDYSICAMDHLFTVKAEVHILQNLYFSITGKEIETNG